ncbi:RRM_1 domain-containing protein [Cephalotus follicularis]|uniref:RRM_1 domain-containing protein n=1 Tax=Cephalotus follicularis TaxID=3775 RepID=A0A1Q3C194_CEPFO|nr:RRM_1 domain-containing protein [Cephalotus follicularis]
MAASLQLQLRNPNWHNNRAKGEERIGFGSIGCLYSLVPPCISITVNVRSGRHRIMHVLSSTTCSVLSCLSTSSPKTRLYVSGLSFRTTEESLRNSFQNFGQLVQVNLVMDKIANRPRGFAFLRYANEDESQKAIEGMHGKFLDGRVIFVEVAKPRSELRPGLKQSTRQY